LRTHTLAPSILPLLEAKIIFWDIQTVGYNKVDLKRISLRVSNLNSTGSAQLKWRNEFNGLRKVKWHAEFNRLRAVKWQLNSTGSEKLNDS
jgi:hypothetical protein